MGQEYPQSTIGGTPDPWMATVRLKVRSGQKNKEMWRIFVKNVFLGILEEAVSPSAPSWLRLWEIAAC